MTCGACCAFFRVSFYWAEGDDANGTVPASLTEQYPLFTDAWVALTRKTPDVLPLQEHLAKMHSVRYMKIAPLHAETSPCQVRTAKSMKHAIVQGLNTGWLRYKQTITWFALPRLLQQSEFRFPCTTKPLLNEFFIITLIWDILHIINTILI